MLSIVNFCVKAKQLLCNSFVTIFLFTLFQYSPYFIVIPKDGMQNSFYSQASLNEYGFKVMNDSGFVIFWIEVIVFWFELKPTTNFQN